jgi:hypothetical protein
VLEPEFKTETIYRTKPSESDSKLDTLLNLCLEVRNIIIEKIPDKQDSDELRILNRFLSEQACIDTNSQRLKANI